MSTESPPDPLIGIRLGGYRIEGLLGKGAMGAVYRAVQVSLNRHVALKVMAGHLVGSEESAARFWREARAAAAINHPNLVRVHDFGEANGMYFYAMELVDGLSLGAYLRRGDRFTERECIEVGREVTLALRAAHRAGIIHRDLKPDNLMLNSEGVVKVADLGVARFLSEGVDEGGESGGSSGAVRDLNAWDSLTMTGVGLGTPAFMSPEQIRAERSVDHRSDFYALGATLFQLATCRVPFPAPSAAEVMEQQISAPVPRARDVNPALGGNFSDIVGWLMAKSPADRPQTHEEILGAFDDCLKAVKGRRGGVSRVRAADAPSWGPAWVGLGVLTLAAVFVWTPKAPEPSGESTRRHATPSSFVALAAGKQGPVEGLGAGAGPRAVAEKVGLESVPPAAHGAISESRTRMVFSLSRDFSTTNNPSGPWTYNQGTSPILAKRAAYGYLKGWGYNANMGSSITRATGAVSEVLSGKWHDLLNGDVLVHTAAHGEPNMSITWTSPEDGVIDIAGSAWDAMFNKGRDSSWELMVDDTVVARSPTIFGICRTDGSASFANNLVAGQTLTGLTVRAGCVVKFLPTTTGTGPYGHFMGVDMTIHLGPTLGPRGLSASAKTLPPARKDQPLVNTLGMRFVPVAGARVLFSVWETRVKDFEAFVKDTGYGWSHKPSFEQGPDHPVVMVSWDDASAFCAWLSKREGRWYRLPTDEEWDAAVGNGKYPWGSDWPPSSTIENVAGKEALLGDSDSPRSVLVGRRDEHPRTAPVGSYKVTNAGLYDMGGNVREWIDGWYTEAHHVKNRAGGGAEPKPDDMAEIKKGNSRRMARGGVWSDPSTGGLASSYRRPLPQGERYPNIGFRCVLEGSDSAAGGATPDWNEQPVVAAGPAAAPAEFRYTTNAGAITITGYKGRGGSVSVPASIDGFPVTAIATSAFYANFRLNSVAIPSSVKMIGGNFHICTNLKAIAVDPDNANYSSVDGVLFNKSEARLIFFPAGKGGDYAVPATVTEIAKMAFAYNGHLTGASIPSGVHRIGYYPFHRCTALRRITVDAANANYCSVDDVLMDKARTRIIQFPLGKTVANYEIPSRVTRIDAFAFLSCVGLSAITVVPANVYYSSADGVLFKEGGKELFVFPAGRTGAYTVPWGVRAISSGAFTDAVGLTNLTIPDTVASIENNAFEGCIGLRGVAVPNSVTAMQGSTFQGCSGLTNVAMPNGVTSIDGQAFFLCRSLADVTIPDSVTRIGYRAFFGCTGLVSVTIPERVTAIDQEAFRECENLTEIYFKGNAPRLGQDVFMKAKNVKKATVYFLSGTSGWGREFDGLATASWDPQARTHALGGAPEK